MAETGPFGLDFLTQVINVHWQGGGFAVGGTAREVTKQGPIGVFYSGKSETTDEPREWNSTRMDPGTPAPAAATDGSIAMGPRADGLEYNFLTSMVGGKIKGVDDQPDQKILVAGGVRNYTTTDNIVVVDGVIVSWHYTNHSTAILFWSDNGGATWTEVVNPVKAPPPSLGVAQDVVVRYLAFDPAAEKFYGDVSLQGASGIVGGTLHFTTQRHLIVSSDGKTWKIEASDIRDTTAGGTDFTSPFLAQILSIKNNGLTEVINTDVDPEIKLTYTTVQVVPDSFGGALKLAPPWKLEGAPADDEPVPPPNHISKIPYGEVVADGTRWIKGFAYANGQFLIAGSLMTTYDNKNWQVLAYSSDDNGKTWQKTLDDGTVPDDGTPIEDVTTFITSNPYSEGGIGCAGSCGCAGA